jgi:hypothetical protein
MQWKIFIHAAVSRNKVILKCSNGTFGGVAAMNVGGHELKIDAIVRQKCF